MSRSQQWPLSQIGLAKKEIKLLLTDGSKDQKLQHILLAQNEELRG